MKKLVLVISAAIFAFTACNRGTIQQAQVPAEVVTSFNERYPEATDVEWREDNGDYEVQFEHNNTDMEATYRPNGTLKNVEEQEGIFGGLGGDQEEANIPQEVLNSFNERYPEATDVEWEEENGEYEVEFDQNGTEMEATYQEDGTLKNVEESEGIFGGLGQEEEPQVPEQVLNRFNQRYPDATDAEWEEQNGNYAVEFEENGTEMNAVYRPNGTLKKIERK